MELIDREKLINDIQDEKHCANCPDIGNYYCVEGGCCEEQIEKLIKDQPTVNTWISVEDRLPTEEEQKNTKIIIVDKYDMYFDAIYDTSDNEWYAVDNGEMYVDDDSLIDVIAWMPIPEYKESEQVLKRADKRIDNEVAQGGLKSAT